MARIRTDRAATLYLIRPLRRCIPSRESLRIPILMYHSISESECQNLHPYFVTETSVQVFETHMKFLSDNGYQTITTEDVVALLNSPQKLTGKNVVITFDDGYRDFYRNAFPILNKYGYRATVYLPTAYINQRVHTFKGKECMTWAEVRELREVGILFGSHTVSHPQLRFVSLPDLEYEVKVSKDTIEDEIGEPIRSFAYPYAFPEGDSAFIHRLRDLLGTCGYKNGVSTVIGSSHSLEDHFFLRRLPANSKDDLALFRAKLEGDYDWLHTAQYLKKLLTKGTPRRSSAPTAGSSPAISH